MATPRTTPTPSGRKSGRAAQFLREVMIELKKTTWPSREELLAQTRLVVGVIIVIGLFIYLVDTALGWVLKLLLRLVGVEAGFGE